MPSTSPLVAAGPAGYAAESHTGHLCDSSADDARCWCEVELHRREPDTIFIFIRGLILLTVTGCAALLACANNEADGCEATESRCSVQLDVLAEQPRTRRLSVPLRTFSAFCAYKAQKLWPGFPGLRQMLTKESRIA